MGISFEANQRLDEEAAEAYALFREAGGEIAAACRLWEDRKGERMPWSNMRRRIVRAIDKGESEHLPAGLPVGQRLQGMSALYNASGEQVLTWVKTRSEPAESALADELTAFFDKYKGRSEFIPAPAHSDADLVTNYILPDQHIGLLAWGEESGVNYDLDIATETIRKATSYLIERTPASKTAVILNLGDWFHSDNMQNRTSRSGHSLDVDGRYARVAQVGVRIMIEAAELAAQKHERVIIVIMRGNHDDQSSVWLRIALTAFFANNPRIEVDQSPAPFWWLKHGRCLVGATHGDKVKPDAMASAMATQQPEAWGGTDFRYFYFGHIHHATKKEVAGVDVESFGTLAPRDAYAAEGGYSSNRAMQAITLHKEDGETTRQTYSVAFTRAKRAILETA